MTRTQLRNLVAQRAEVDATIGLLKVARGIQQERGWVRGKRMTPTGECCPLAAIDMACTSLGGIPVPVKVLAQHTLDAHSPGDDIVWYSDHMAHSLEQVISVFDQAIMVMTLRRRTLDSQIAEAKKDPNDEITTVGG